MNRTLRVYVKSFAMIIMTTGLLLGCGINNNSKLQFVDSLDANGIIEEEKTVLKIYVDSIRAQDTNFLDVVHAFERDTDYKLEFNLIPGDGKDIYKKIDIDLGSKKSDTDIILFSNPILLDKYSENNMLLPINDLIDEQAYDVDRIYGDYITTYNDNIYSLPAGAGRWAVYYNKKIFDDAHIPYPSGAWTWDDYIETAQKLMVAGHKFGSYMLDYDNYLYFIARQKGIPLYKEDGLSNYDHPSFKESLRLFAEIGNVYQIQPNWLEFKTKKLPWDGFMTGEYGLTLIGTWYTNMFLDKKLYPRDWEFGITQLPTPSDGLGDNNLGNVNSIGINKYSKHPLEAFEFVKYFAENNYKFTGDLPARIDLKEEDRMSIFRKTEEKLNGEVTAQQFNDALYNTDLGFMKEKISGPVALEYSQIILEEGELYLIGVKSLDDAVHSIKSRVDTLITDKGVQ
ncbi:ABC transporter substrate-binding protein [Paenibacillus antarcticus]|uniref:ABC transporter substrate-binding protein n=1 Tax=Paenibacillus antarcticus TaxID=253703 RepID=A0A168L949_9BACL|nr:extracellular solute-binding protein [Paenibacillus antarcticus]OAB43049.1 hypothetical protein PBAT_18795 [Paenibacillus antarcticus]